MGHVNEGALLLVGLSLNHVVEEAVVEADFGGVVHRGCVVAVGNFCPDNGAQAHGTGLAGGVQDAVVEGEAVKFSAGVADCDNFSVVGGVVGDEHSVVAASNDFASLLVDDNRSEGAAVTDLNA